MQAAVNLMATEWSDVRCVLFDLDGTLLDSAADLGAAANAMRASRGLAALPLGAYRSRAGMGARGMLAAAFEVHPGDQCFGGLKEEFFAEYQACMLCQTRPFLGVETVVAALNRSGLSWGVVTNKASRFTTAITDTLPMFRGASTIVSGDTTSHTKPHPAPLIEAMRRVGAMPVHTVYVGDDERDIQAGHAAGVRTVVARYGYLGLGAEPSAWGADAQIDEPTQLLKLLKLT